MEIKIYDQELEDFIHALQKPTIAKTLRAIDLLKFFGHQLGMPHSKKIAPDLFELRVRGAQEIRILYSFFKNRAVLIHGFMKKTNRLPKREIERARRKLDQLVQK